MGKALLISALLSLCFIHAKGQLSKTSIHGVWRVGAMGKAGNDTVTILDRDSNMQAVFPKLTFVHVGDLINSADDPIVYMSYSLLGTFSNNFLQFDSTGIYGEGTMPVTADEKPILKRGSYELAGNTLSMKTRKTETANVSLQSGYLIITSDTGNMVYLKKISNALY